MYKIKHLKIGFEHYDGKIDQEFLHNTRIQQFVCV
jgi:hypothetical protein